MTKKPIIIHSKYLKDKDLHELWKILGRIHSHNDFNLADDSGNSVYPSENAEIFIGFYDD